MLGLVRVPELPQVLELQQQVLGLQQEQVLEQR